MVDRIRNLLYDIQCAEQTRHKLEFQILQNQINPHFLHNTLNTIRYMAYVQKEENIVTVVDSLSVLLRNNMRANEYLTIEEEAQSLRSYLEIQTFKYSGKYVYTVEVEPGLEQYRILKMLIQPLVENALKHGIAPSDRPGLSRCRCFRTMECCGSRSWTTEWECRRRSLKNSERKRRQAYRSAERDRPDQNLLWRAVWRGAPLRRVRDESGAAAAKNRNEKRNGGGRTCIM